MLKLQVGIITFGVVLVLLSCFIGEYDASRRSSRRRRSSSSGSSSKSKGCDVTCDGSSCQALHLVEGCGKVSTGGGGGGGGVGGGKFNPFVQKPGGSVSTGKAEGCNWQTGKSEGKSNIRVGTGLSYARCASTCRWNSKTNSAINGAQYEKINGLCSCVTGMHSRIAFLTTYESCYLKETAVHGCILTPGEGLPKTSWVNKGNLKGAACINACVEARKTKPSINGLTMGLSKCYCYYDMNGIDTSAGSTVFFKSCFLEANPKADPEKPVTESLERDSIQELEAIEDELEKEVW